MPKPKAWTSAGVRHKTPRWYWVRPNWHTDASGWPCMVWLDVAGGTWYAHAGASSAPWPDDYERTVAPIREPGE